MSCRLLCAAVALAVSLPTARADETTEKQKKVAAENLRKADVNKGVVVETEHLFVAGALTEARAKAVGESLEKVYKLARKVLQYEDKEEPWKGKLAVYVITESREFRQFMRIVALQRAEDPQFVTTRGEEPMAVAFAEFGPKATDADYAAEAGVVVAAALLNAKAGTAAKLPEWMKTGFGKAVAMRAEGTMSKRFMDYKAAARTAVLGGKGMGPAVVGDVWGGTRKDGDVLAASLMDYVAFGPGSANFGKFLGGFRPTENVPEPGVAQALEAAMWKEPALDAAWKAWVQKGMPVK